MSPSVNSVIEQMIAERRRHNEGQGLPADHDTAEVEALLRQFHERSLDVSGTVVDMADLLEPRATLEVLRAVAGERAAQDRKWGRQVHDYGTWKAVLGEEEGEADREFLRLKFTAKNRGAAFRTELVQAAAVLVAMVECGDRMFWFAERPEVDPPSYQRTGEETI